ncbi:MAG TPA: glycosyltransferase family 4 protein [Acidimicrobiia bacterium]|nr:glycosyltransferase family 4 protein [Acidimicrobiia bacterium]
MRVAVVSPYDLSRFGGVQGQVIGLVEGLRALGHDAWAVGPRAPAGLGIDVGASVRVRFNGSQAPICLEPGVGNRTRAALDGADTVHLHEPLVPLIGPSAWRAAGPLTLTFHASPPRWVSFLYRVVPAHWWEDRVLTAVSRVAADPLPAPAELIPNGLDVTSFQVEAERHPMRVVFLGRDEPRKGLQVLMRAWPQVRSKIPGAELVVMSSASLPGEGGVQFRGKVSEEEKRATLAGAAVLVAPNLGGESFGITVAEGMAAGCAIVASDLPAFREVTAGSARLVAPGDVPGLAAALIEVLDDPQGRGKMQAAGRRRAAAFDWSVVIPRYLECYRKGAPSPSG